VVEPESPRTWGWHGVPSLISEMSVATTAVCSGLHELWIRGRNGEAWNRSGNVQGGRGDMDDVRAIRIGPVRSAGWVDWLQVVRSGSNRVAQSRSIVTNTKATPRCNINIKYIYITLGDGPKPTNRSTDQARGGRPHRTKPACAFESAFMPLVDFDVLNDNLIK
jgi:hypothetical protein